MTSTVTLAARSLAFSRLASLLVAIAALTALAGWLGGEPAWTSLYLPGPTLKTNAAVSLASLGIANLLFVSGWRWLRPLASICALLPVVVGGATLSQHLVGWDLGIDQLIAHEAAGALATTSPNRMGPPASTALLLLGAALLFLARPSVRAQSVGQLLAIVTCAIVLLPVMGYAYGFSELYSVARYTGIAMVTAVALLLLGLAVQAGRPQSGLSSLLCRDDEVGVLSRRLLFAGVALPFGIGWALARMFVAGFIDAPFALSAIVLALTVLLATLIWRTGARLAVSTDARSTSERALTESERSLREADHQKSEFLATLSHELRNPLAPIRFAIELLDGPAPVAARARHTIVRQVQHLTRLVDDLLDLTRVTSNKLELHIRACELRPLVQDAVDAVASEVARGRHRLDVALPAPAIWLQADPDRVVQMLVNLLTNACRYSDPGGLITIAAHAHHGAVVIAVRDAGRGLDPDDLERVFDRFVQVGESRQGGLGVGLAIVRALAALHGGTAEAHSEGRGRGAEFRLRLPCAVGPPPAAPPAPLPPVASRRILVVDDNRDAADMLGGLLAAGGHHVAVAYGGIDALRLATEFDPEVGLIDVGMPDVDGYHVAARLRSRADGNVFLVAITGWGQDADRRRALASGFDAHLTKPAEPVALAALLAARFSRTGV
ncbi:MAG: ATP-binding protein [Vicinamibacteraceae bacterium]